VVEGVHFTRATFRPQEIGHKALAVNLSDLAAMGARPVWFVCAVAMPRQTAPGFIKRLAQGMAGLARRHGILLVGGNFSRAGELSLTLTCAGEVPRGQALLRSGASPKDFLYVSGTLGDARMGVPNAPSARQRQPQPRVRLGELARPFASAAMDISDSLARDLTSLCRQSGVGARVQLETLPSGPAVRRAVRNPRQRALIALVGGEDYELLLAVPPRKRTAFERACARAGERVTQIGMVTRARTVRFLWDEVAVRPPAGFDHFA
jgi:thiamine-monophosphate kinase